MDLTIGYYLTVLVGLAQMGRKLADYKFGPYKPRKKEIYLVGAVGGAALALIGAILWISTGPDPILGRDAIRIGSRVAFLGFALATGTFETAYWVDRLSVPAGQAPGALGVEWAIVRAMLAEKIARWRGG